GSGGGKLTVEGKRAAVSRNSRTSCGENSWGLRGGGSSFFGKAALGGSGVLQAVNQNSGNHKTNERSMPYRVTRCMGQSKPEAQARVRKRTKLPGDTTEESKDHLWFHVFL